METRDAIIGLASSTVTAFISWILGKRKEKPVKKKEENE